MNLEDDQTVSGIKTFSAIPAFNGGASGSTAPFTVDSTTKVTNLNSDLLDDQDGPYYLDYNNFTNIPTIGNGNLTLNVSGTGLSGSATFTANQTGDSTFTVTSNATSNNTASTIVARDASGNFSAGTITATLNGGINKQDITGVNTFDPIYLKMADNDFFRIRVGGTASNAG